MPIRHAALYDAARVAARSRAAELPFITFRRGTRFYRNVGASLGGGGLTGANLARRVYESEDNAWNRWTGRTPHGGKRARGGIGGLYVTLDVDALIGEMFHYTFETSVEDELRTAETPPRHRPAGALPPLTRTKLTQGLMTRRIYAYVLASDVIAGDLAFGSGRGRRFLEDVWQADVVRDAVQQTPYRSMLAACEASFDHSFARGVCQGLHDARPTLAAIRVTSVRTRYETTLHQSGENVVFLGEDDTPIDVLVPDHEISFARGPGRKLRQVTTWLAPAATPAAGPAGGSTARP